MIHDQGDAEYFIVDLGSSNGTYVAGKRVVQPTRLTDGVEIQIGETRLIFRQPAVQISSFLEESGSGTLMDVRMVRSWLLLADLQGSTRLSQEMPAEELARLTGRWFSECRQVIERHGGAVNKFLGDGFLAYWPAALADPDLLVQGLLALKQLQSSSTVAFRLVLHQGSVIVGGGPTMGEENLSGPEVNFTFRIEKLAGGLKCSAMMSAAARDQLGGRLATTPLGSHAVQGFPGTPEFFAF
jgi:adenylate cyclase